MKKTIAGIGAVVLGMTGVAVSTAPAQATTTGCSSAGDHNVSAGTAQADSDWYMDCVPQYGVGKAEFTVTSDTEFSSDFDLTDPTYATATSTLPDAAADYVDSTTTGSFETLSRDSTDTNSQSYNGEAILPITAVTKISSADLPVGCNVDGATYQGAYRVDYGTSTTTFTTTDAAGQSVDGQPGVFSVAATAPSLYLGLNFTDGDIDRSASFCASSANGGVTQWSTSPGFPESLAIDEQAIRSGDITMAPTAVFSTLDLGTSALQSAAKPVISTMTLPSATVGTPYSTTVAATSPTPVTWSTTGSLPAGLSIDASSGVISGTPSATGVSTFAVVATNAGGSTSATLSITTSAAAATSSVTTLTTTGSSYGKTAKATAAVTVGGAAATGFVAFTIDGKAGAWTQLVNGGISAPLTGLKPGKHAITASYQGSTAVAGSSAAASVVITKGVTSTTFRLNKHTATARSTHLRASITVKTPGASVLATGKVVITVDGKRVRYGVLKNGHVTVTLPALTKKKSVKVVATYLTTSLYKSDKSTVSVVTVR